MAAGHRFAAAAFVAACASGLSAQNVAPAGPEILRVTSYADDGSAGTLRAAIETSNAAPGRYRIELPAIGQAPYVVRLRSPLPPIVGPVQIEGMAWRETGAYVVVDGSGYIPSSPEACPGAVSGQYGTNVRTTTSPGFTLVDTAGVEIAGLEIRRFCIGILLNRTSGSSIHDNRIVGNHGGAGVMMTGDDGRGNATATTTIHNRVQRNSFLDNGDGLELTRGAAFNLVADNLFRSTAANPEPSQGIEILRGNDNVVARNRFEGYSDGVQINSGDRNDLSGNTFAANVLGVSVTGTGNVIEGNTMTGNTIGVAVRPSAVPTVVRITENSISGNGVRIRRCEAGGSCDPNLRTGGIVLGVPGPEHAEYVGSHGGGVTPNASTVFHICPHEAPACQPMPNGGIQAPRLTGVHQTAQGLTIAGVVRGTPRRLYRIEVFGNRQRGGAEGEIFLASAPAATGADGSAEFSVTIDRAPRTNGLATFTATATSAEGATSEFSQPLALR
jgi:3-dehydroshikimate dehydratase